MGHSEVTSSEPKGSEGLRKLPGTPGKLLRNSNHEDVTEQLSVLLRGSYSEASTRY